MHLKSNVIHEVERETSGFVDLVGFFFPENVMDRQVLLVVERAGLLAVRSTAKPTIRLSRDPLPTPS